MKKFIIFAVIIFVSQVCLPGSKQFAKETGIELNAADRILIYFGAFTHKIFDQDKILNENLIKVERKGEIITFHIPIEVLGSPQYILTCAVTSLGAVPLAHTSWRVLKI